MISTLIKKHHRKAILTVPILFLVLARGAAPPAYSIVIRPNAYFPEVGTQFGIDVDFHSPTAVNAIEGTLHYPSGIVSVSKVDTNRSAIDLWDATPEWSDGNGVVTWSGGIIHPIQQNGSYDGNILRVLATAKKATPFTLGISDASLLAGDGSGRDMLGTIGGARIYPRPQGMPDPDVDGDHTITARDIAQVILAIGRPYNKRFDFNRDGKIDFSDVGVILDYYDTLNTN